MAIGDLLFSLMGQPNPQQQLARAFNQFPGQAGSRSGPVPGPGAGAAAPGLAQAGGGAQAGAPPPQQPQPEQQQPPQPQAYQTPPDLGQIYLNLMQRQQANAQINTGLGLLAGAFSHNQNDRSNMISAMSGLNQNMGNPTEQVGALAQLQQTVWQRQMMMAQMQHLPEIAKQLGITPEMATGLFYSGKLGDVMQNISQSQYQQGTPEYKANVGKALADTGLAQAQTGAIPATVAKTQAETGEAVARTNAIPATVAKTQAETGLTQAQTGAVAPTIEKTKAETAAALATIPKTQADVAQIQAQTAKAQQDLKYPTDASKNYSFYANDEIAGKRQPVSFSDWMASGGQNPTEQMKDYRLAMSQVPEGQPKPTFNEWTANIAGMKEAYTQSALLQTQQKMQAQGQLPDATQKISDQLKLADDILNDKSLDSLTGWGGTSIGKLVNALPGTQGAALQAKIDQLAGSAGVSAVESLKGVGRILGTEFAAGTEAQSRLHDQTMTGKDYKDAILDYRNKVANQLRIVYQRAGMPVPPELDAQLKGPVQKLSNADLLKKYVK